MAITYGMSVKEFWEEDPDLFWAYRFSYFDKLKSEQEIFNQNAWLQGGYICEAVTVAINNCFSKNKLEYSSQPYGTSNTKKDYKTRQETLVANIKGRVKQIQAIKGSKISSTTEEGIIEGGEITNERANIRIAN